MSIQSRVVTKLFRDRKLVLTLIHLLAIPILNSGKNYGPLILSPDIKCFSGGSSIKPFLLEVNLGKGESAVAASAPDARTKLKH